MSQGVLRPGCLPRPLLQWPSSCETFTTGKGGRKLLSVGWSRAISESLQDVLRLTELK